MPGVRKNPVIIRPMSSKDFPMIVELQKVAFPLMAAEGVYWRPHHLEEHLKVFPEGQFVAEYKDKIIGSCSSLIIQLDPEYKEHTHGKKYVVEVSLRIIIQKEIHYMEQMFQPILTIEG